MGHRSGSTRVAATSMFVALLSALSAPNLTAQTQTLLLGRVEDAISRAPVAGARIVAPDSMAVFTDSLGTFSIVVDGAGPFRLGVQQYGYAAEVFDLPEEAPSVVSVLLIEPAAIELAEINVVSESAVSELFRDLRSRRNRYRGSVWGFDKARLEERWPVGSAWDVVVSRVPGVFECDSFLGSPERWTSIKSGLCVPARGRTFGDPNPQTPILVCVDAWESWSAVSELESLDIRQVALIEVFGRGTGGVRVYTAGYLAVSARAGRNIATPIEFGC